MLTHPRRLLPLLALPLLLAPAAPAGDARPEEVELGEQYRAGSAVDGAVDPAAAQERLVRGVDNGVHSQEAAKTELTPICPRSSLAALPVH